MWQAADLKRSLKFAQFQTAKLYSKLESAEYEFDKVLSEVKTLDRQISFDHPLRKHITTIVNTAKYELDRRKIGALASFDDQEPLSFKYLTSLHYKVIQKMRMYTKYE